jgi:vacuolar-type H+-ATPase subunit E/Vma4
MENIIQHGVAVSSLAELLSYLEALLKEALDPYKEEVKGQWNATSIHQNIVQAYARAYTLKEFTISRAKEGKDNPYGVDKEIREVAYHLCQEIDLEIVRYFSEHGKGLIWVPDFNAYGEAVYQKMAQILQEADSFENNKVSNHRINMASL